MRILAHPNTRKLILGALLGCMALSAQNVSPPAGGGGGSHAYTQ
jgi:hypothetical protein